LVGAGEGKKATEHSAVRGMDPPIIRDGFVNLIIKGKMNKDAAEKKKSREKAGEITGDDECHCHRHRH
jgi:hypothetical protein